MNWNDICHITLVAIRPAGICMKEEKIASGGELMYSDLFLHFGNGKNKAVFAEH